MSETVYRRITKQRHGELRTYNVYEPIEPNPLDEVERLKATISMDTVRLKLALEAILSFTENERIHGSAWQRIRHEAQEAIDAALGGVVQPVQP